MMRKLILFAAVGVVAACGSAATDGGSPDSGNGRTGPAQFNLTINTSGNGAVRGAGADCRGSCTTQAPSGQQFHLVAVPDSGATFTGWSAACSGAGGCDLTLDADRQVTAVFGAAAPPPPPPRGQNRLTVVVQGKGRVTSSPSGLDCDSSQCSADFTDGTTVTLTAAASSGYGFDGWGSGCSGAGGCTVSLSRDATVYANFVAQQPPPPPPPAQVHLIASTAGPGTVTGGGLNCGESSSTCDVMVATGSQVTLTASPAGGARFFGWGGACSGTAGTCQLALQSDTKVTAEFQSEVIALVPNDGTNGTAMALNSTSLFWQRFTSSGNAIWAVPKKGGDSFRVAGAYATSIVADDSYLYWTDGSNLYSTPVGGGQVALLFSGAPIGKLVLDETGALYWTVGTRYGSSPSGTVHRMQDRADTVLATGQTPVSTAIAVDAVHVYFGSDNGASGSIRRVPRKGGSVESVVDCGSHCSPSTLRLDQDNLYFRVLSYASESGQVQVMSKTDFKIRTIAGSGSATYQYAMDVEVNAGLVYWNWTGVSGPYGIFSAKADGTGFRTIDGSDDAAWYALRVDDAAIYYWHAAAIIRRLK